MKFATVPIDQAEGALLAHAIRLPQLFIAKGRPIAAEDIALLRAAGVQSVAVALIEDGDVVEDVAAARVARLLAGRGIAAREANDGRCNLCAVFQGLLHFDPGGVDALNHIDEAITLGTLPVHEPVEQGAIVATIKVNPYAVAEDVVAAWEQAAAPLSVAPFRPHRVSLIQTMAPGLKASVLEKTSHATRERLEAFGSALCTDLRAPHEEQALARAIAQRRSAGDDLILICGACSIADRKDVVPAAIELAGGRVDHYGMPVDPGNLLLLGGFGDIPVIGMPGCARTPQLNGFDYVLRLVLAGLSVGREEIMSMGVGGLLRDIPWRARTTTDPTFGRKPPASPRIAAVVLAAGQSSRMGTNKLAEELDGKPVLRHVVDTILAARVENVVVVLGHQAEEMRALLASGDVECVVNERYRKGLSTSLKAGIAALPEDIEGAMIFLGDMPDIDASLIARLIGAFDPARMRAIVVPQRGGRQGNPVLWGRAFFPTLLEKTHGDAGAKHLIRRYAEWVAEVAVDDEAIFTDLDTAEALDARRQHGRRNGGDDLVAEIPKGDNVRA
jgi:molybdenum cofactor cytidylyltransferase